MDLDIEMDDAGQEPLMEEPSRSNADDILQQPDEPEEVGEVVEDGEAQPVTDESQTIVPEKVHIRGLDTLSTDDIRTYVKSHYEAPERVEWIDDTSANLRFGTEAAARDAIVALSSIEIADPSALSIGETLLAKQFEAKPEITLHIRLAVQSDKKAPGAAQRSRFYLLNPEYDPEERRRRTKYRDRDGDRRRSERYSRHDSEDAEPFDASFYDDVPRSSRDRRHSASPDRLRSYARENRGKELFAGHRRGRDRSASPRRDNEGDESMDGERSGSSRNRASARAVKATLAADTRNKSKELFPTKMSGGRGGRLDQLETAIGSAQLKEEDRPKVVDVPDSNNGSFNIRGSAAQRGGNGGFSIKGAANAKELFPGKFGGNNAGKELLDGKEKRGPRQRAEDLFG